MIERIWIRFADNGNLRKWATAPFEGATEYRAIDPNAEPASLTEQIETARRERGE